jgi:sugar phosphate isomerase/epimerase
MTDKNISRRNFVKTTTGLALGAAALPVTAPLLAAEKTRPPVGCRDLHLKVAGKSDCWSCMTALGAEVTEVSVELNLACGSLFHPERKYSLATDDEVKVLKDDLAASGRRISAFLMSNRFDERLDQEAECASRLVKAAEHLGVRAIRIDVVPRTLKGDEFLPFAIKACKRMCEVAQGVPVKYGVENHSTTANDPAFLEKLFDGVGSPQLGLTLDVGNFYWWGHALDSLYGIYQKFASRVVHTHCKNIHYPEDKRNSHREMGWEYAKYNCPIYDGDIDYKRVVEILRKADYRGDLCVEDESLGKFPEAERARVVRQEIEMLKKLAS